MLCAGPAARPGGVALLAALMLAALPAGAEAGTTRGPATSCHGALTRAPTTDEPNLLAYRFTCNGALGGYSLLVNRRDIDFQEIDDFSTTADGFYPRTTYGPVDVSDPKSSFNCGGSLPGAGINCNGVSTAGETVQGTIDLSEPYCGGVPSDGPRTAAPLPKAIVQLVVADGTGAPDGPFRLNLVPGCPQPKPKPKPKPKHKKHTHAHPAKPKHTPEH